MDMKHLGTQRLETDRLILRALRESDAQAMYQNWANSTEVTQFLTWPPHENVEVTQKLLALWVPQYEQLDFYQWAIVLKTASDEPIGTISVVDADDRIEKMEIGYCLGQDFWQQGIMSEALAAVVRFLFENVGVNRLESRHDVLNPGSGAVLQKGGFLYEGTRRAAELNNQGVCDTCVYGLLQSDYKENKK